MSESAGDGIVTLADLNLHHLGEQGGGMVEFREGQCGCRPATKANGELVELPLSKSLFRMVLARVAAMCEELLPGEVSPYGAPAK